MMAVNGWNGPLTCLPAYDLKFSSSSRSMRPMVAGARAVAAVECR
jgi:hypothetical protein